MTQEKLDNLTKTKTTSEPESSRTSTTTSIYLGPSPTAWTASGCYVGDPKIPMPIFEKRMTEEGGDVALTISKCQNACYLEALQWVGVKAGNECWCSDYVYGDLAGDESECNLPCSGDKDEICGGKDGISVFEPAFFDDGPEDPKPTTQSTSEPGDEPTTPSTSKSGDEPTTLPTEPANSGSTRNFALF